MRPLLAKVREKVRVAAFSVHCARIVLTLCSCTKKRQKRQKLQQERSGSLEAEAQLWPKAQLYKFQLNCTSSYKNVLEWWMERSRAYTPLDSFPHTASNWAQCLASLLQTFRTFPTFRTLPSQPIRVIAVFAILQLELFGSMFEFWTVLADQLTTSVVNGQPFN